MLCCVIVVLCRVMLFYLIALCFVLACAVYIVLYVCCIVIICMGVSYFVNVLLVDVDIVLLDELRSCVMLL